MSNPSVTQQSGMVRKLVQQYENTLKELEASDFDYRRNEDLPKSVGKVKQLIKIFEKGDGSLVLRKAKENKHNIKLTPFADFHNHWDGILPVDRLIALYREHARPLQECELPPRQAPPGPPNIYTEEWMFLRLSASILHHKGNPRNGNQAPARGAHLMQYVVIYVWWTAYLEGIRDPQLNWAPAHYRDLWQSTLSVLGDLYTSLRNRDTSHLRPLAMHALRKYLRATKTAPFDDAFVARSSLLKLIPRSLVDADTVDYLVNIERIQYLQVSNPPDKINEPKQQIDSFNAAHPDRQITVHWLALIASQRAFMDNPAYPQYDNDAVGNDSAVAMAAINGDIGGGNVRGLDWAGPECQEFRLGPAISLVRETLTRMHQISAAQNRPVIFRPHVGEGSSLLEGGRSLIETEPEALINMVRACYLSLHDALQANQTPELVERLFGAHLTREVLRHRDDSFQVLAGEAYQEAVRRATNNVGTLIEAISQYYRGAPPPNSDVKIRFGHVTHATDEHARLMRDLRIAADINLSSNLRTGALSYMQRLDEGDFYKEAFNNWNWNASALDGFLTGHQHSIFRLCPAGVKVVLGSDGQGVEVSAMAYEYLLAQSLIGDNLFNQVIGANVQDQMLL